METLNRKFTEEEVCSIMYDGAVYDENDNQLFETVHEQIVDVDQEKSSTSVEYVIKDLSTGKLYKSTLGKSPWIHQDEYNAKAEWTLVKARKKTVTEYY